jgi:hypothetical protein
MTNTTKAATAGERDALLSDALALFRRYQQEHEMKASEAQEWGDNFKAEASREKARTNNLIADRIDQFLTTKAASRDHIVDLTNMIPAEAASPEGRNQAQARVAAYICARDFMNTGIMDFVDDHPTGSSDGDPIAILSLSDLRILIAPASEGAKADEWLSRPSVRAESPVAWFCKACNSPRAIAPCQKCNGALQASADGWEWPDLPDIDRIRALAREVGYGIGVHGSLERDLDLIAIPWTEGAVSPPELAAHIARGLPGRVLDDANQDKPSGRWSCNISPDGWFKMIDLSVMPPVEMPR